MTPVTVALILGGIVGVIGGAKMLFPTRPSSPLVAFIHDRIVRIAHLWVTVVHELGHWFWGLPSGILSWRIIPHIVFEDEHNASVRMPIMGGPIGWILRPIYSFGGYMSPVLLGGFFLWLSSDAGKDHLMVGQVVLSILAVVMVLGSRSIKTFLFATMPVGLALLNFFLMTNPSQELAGFSSALLAFLGMVLLLGGIGDVIAVNLWAITPGKLRLFFSTDFGLLTGWKHDGINGDPMGDRWVAHARGPFFLPHLALLVFDAVFMFVCLGYYNLLIKGVDIADFGHLFSFSG